ncbi:hypothetical protein ACEQ8H_006253 [Pleosporales sp. CAS-2024a]
MTSPTTTHLHQLSRPRQRPRREKNSREPEKKPKKANSEIRKQQNRIASRNYRASFSALLQRTATDVLLRAGEKRKNRLQYLQHLIRDGSNEEQTPEPSPQQHEAHCHSTSADYKVGSSSSPFMLPSSRDFTSLTSNTARALSLEAGTSGPGYGAHVWPSTQAYPPQFELSWTGQIHDWRLVKKVIIMHLLGLKPPTSQLQVPIDMHDKSFRDLTTMLSAPPMSTTTDRTTKEAMYSANAVTARVEGCFLFFNHATWTMPSPSPQMTVRQALPTCLPAAEQYGKSPSVFAVSAISAVMPLSRGWQARRPHIAYMTSLEDRLQKTETALYAALSALDRRDDLDSRFLAEHRDWEVLPTIYILFSFGKRSETTDILVIVYHGPFHLPIHGFSTGHQRNTSAPNASRITLDSAAYSPLGLDPVQQENFHGSSQSSQLSSSTMDSLKQQDGTYAPGTVPFNSFVQDHRLGQDSNSGYPDTLDPFSGFDIPFWFEQDQQWLEGMFQQNF